MPTLITSDLLREVASHPLQGLKPEQAIDACYRLGALARWWLRPEVLRLAREHDPSIPAVTCPRRPGLPETLGACWVVFVAESTLPLLRPAFLLPLCWKPDEDHDRELPPKLVDLARNVSEQVREKKWSCQRWGLRRGEVPGLSSCQLGEGLEFTYGSGWAPLAAGLILRAEGLTPCRTVWATGAWDRGLAEVKCLKAKLHLAVQWEATDFFVPAWRVNAARDWLTKRGVTGMEVGALTTDAKPNPRQTLRGYLARLSGRPAAPQMDRPGWEEEFDICKAYYRLLPPKEQPARGFYASHLLPGIVRWCRERIRADCSPTHLVTVVSDSPEVIPLVAQALGVKQVLLLHTSDYDAEREAAQAELRDAKGVPGLFAYGEEMEDEMRGHIQRLLSGVEVGRVVFDLTPGSKLMTLTLEKLARRDYPGSWMLYIKHTTPNGRPEPGTEKPVLWRSGQEGL